MKKAWTLVALATLAGCATTVQARSQTFTGDPYDLVARNDVIAGTVCSQRVQYAVYQKPEGIELLGARRLGVRDENGARHIFDLEARRVSAQPLLDVWVDGDHIRGRVGYRNFSLEAKGDVYRGGYTQPNMSGQGDIEVAGRGELLRLPRPVMAAIVGPLLTCTRRRWDPRSGNIWLGLPNIEDPIAVRVGGPAHYETSDAR